MYKIGFIQAGYEKLTVYFDGKAKVNPFRVYLEYYGQDNKHHKKQVGRYANLASCGDYMNWFTRINDREEM